MEESRTHFTQDQVSFPKPINNKLKTEDFLNASLGVISLLEKLGKVFALPRCDMSGNIDKIKSKYDEDHEKFEYMEDMLLIEKRDGELYATNSLMWLRRGLHFILVFFENIANDVSCQEDLTESVKVAYANTLEKYHGWFASNLFKVLIRLVPNRNSIIKYIALGNENCDAIVLKDLKQFTVDLRICIDHLVEFYNTNGLESEDKV